MAIITYVIVGLISLLVYLYNSSKKRINLPGPWGFPFIGSALQLEKRFYQTFQKWTKKYGDIYYVKLGKDEIVVISDPKMVRELYALDSMTGRMPMPVISLFENEPHVGLINSQGEHWEQLRRFTLRQLRDFGFGKSSMEALIMEEVKELNETLKSSNGRPIPDIKHQFSLAVVNSLWMIVSGERYSHQDPRLRTLVRKMTESFDEAAKAGGILFFVSWVKHILPEFSGYNSIRKMMESVVDFVTSTVNSHKATYPEDDSPRDFIDVFLKEMKLANDPKSAFYKENGEKHIVNSISDLFLAGSDTTSTTLNWAFLYLCRWPQVQKKFQDEIKGVTGNSRPVSVADRPNMPYTCALIEEILRYSSIIPNGVPHRALADTDFRGVTIPKNTLIFTNSYFIHHNPAIWGDPEKFRPERFLLGDGKVFRKNENLMPFLVGRRVCLGETLARDSIFLFLTNTFQQWNISFDPSEPEPPLLPAIGLINMNTEPYKIVVKKRE